MNIREKLKFLDQVTTSKKENYTSARTDFSIDRVIDGEIIVSDGGKTFVHTIEFDIEENHGSFQLNQISDIKPYYLKLAGKDNDLLQMDLRKSLFFDTETTGLSGGSGTYIFLAGFGFFKKNKFIIKQYFLRDFPEELFMLTEINELISKFDSLISFNGKSYDLPLLKDRFIFNRLKLKLRQPPHLDLLHAARRIWKNSLPDCSLNTLERTILKVFRAGDVPSYLIPAMYFEYLRTKDARPMKNIFYHNKIDILSMVSLTIALHNIHKSPFEHLSNNVDLFSLTRHYHNMNLWQHNIPLYKALLKSEKNLALKKEIGIHLGFCYKKIGDTKKAINIWNNLKTDGFFRIEPYEELAKYYEHKLGDFEKAKQIVEEALKNLELVGQLRGTHSINQDKANMLYRLKRIKKNLNR